MLMNVFNMGFGDNILLQKDKEPLFVDRGSKRKDNVTFRIEWIRSCMNAPKRISFMFTVALARRLVSRRRDKLESK